MQTFSTLATLIGVYQTMDSISSGKECERTVKYIVLGIIGSLLWIVHQWQNGEALALLWSEVGLVFQLYFLKQALDHERQPRRVDDMPGVKLSGEGSFFHQSEDDAPV
jgi:hypothetical protein